MAELYETFGPQLRKLPEFVDVQACFVRHTERASAQSLNSVLAVDIWERQLLDSLADLANILYTCYGRPCILLLDEFDVPFMEAEVACKCTPNENGESIDVTCECTKSAGLLSSMLKKALKVLGILIAPVNAYSSLFLFVGQSRCQPLYHHWRYDAS